MNKMRWINCDNALNLCARETKHAHLESERQFPKTIPIEERDWPNTIHLWCCVVSLTALAILFSFSLFFISLISPLSYSVVSFGWWCFFFHRPDNRSSSQHTYSLTCTWSIYYFLLVVSVFNLNQYCERFMIVCSFRWLADCRFYFSCNSFLTS